MSTDRPCATHEWREVPGERMQYCCIACAASGYRREGGPIIPHRQQKRPKPAVTMPNRLHRDGRVPPKRGAP